MHRYYKEISELVPVTTYKSAPFCVISLGPKEKMEDFLATFGSQLLPPLEIHYLYHLALSEEYLKNQVINSVQEWILLLDPCVTACPHAILSLNAAVESTECDALTAGELYCRGQVPIGGCVSGVTTLAAGDEKCPGTGNLLIRRGLLLRLLEEYPLPCTVVSAANIIGFLVRSMLLEGIPISRLPKMLFCRQADTSKAVKLFPQKGKKRLWAYSHEFSLTGAPIVFHQAVKVLHQTGYDIHVISNKDGPMFDAYQKDGISVSVDESLQEKDDSYWRQIAENYDGIMISTIVGYWLIEKLKKWKIPVFWWIHDADLGYHYLSGFLPDTIGDQVHIYCGGGYALKVLHRYRPKYPAENLIYGLPDKKDDVKEAYPLEKDGKILISSIGSIEKRKGQDILSKAISLLPQDTIKKCKFLFVGKKGDADIFSTVMDICKKFPENTIYIPSVSRDEINSIYLQSDCISLFADK